ncbi:MAG: SurA N-terminal domain-containing protein [Opitutaceae bacterium]
MISWIQKYFQHHFRIIFAVLLGLLIISFVFTIGPSGLGGSRTPRQMQREFFGHNLNSEEEVRRLTGDAELSFRLNPTQGYNSLGDYVQQRVAALHLADELHLPPTAQSEIADFIKRLPSFAGADGQFDATAYKNFRDSLKGNTQLTEADISRVLADDIRAQKAHQLVAGPGYVLPTDVRQQLVRADTTWTLATATADYASFTPEVKPTEAELTKFFEDNGFRYEIPPRVVASYVGFPSSDQLNAVTVTEAEVRAYYDANPVRFPKAPAEKAATPAIPTLQTDANADFVVVRPQVESALKFERAQNLALKAAVDFVLSVHQGKVAPGPALDALLAARKLTAQPLTPFNREQGPAELGGSPEIADVAFRLNAERYYSDALPTPTGAAILLWKETLPSQKPLFTDVRAKVAADYVENEKQKRFVELGRTLHTQLETRLKAGDTFEKAVGALPSANGLKIEAKTLAAFTPRTRPPELDSSVLGALDQLEKGHVSDMIVTPEKGIFVYAVDKQAPVLSETNPQYATTRTQLGAFTARLTSASILSELVEKEIKRTEPKVE